jgi:hypothetical protein
MNTLCAEVGVRLARAVSIGLAAAAIAACGGGGNSSPGGITGANSTAAAGYTNDSAAPVRRSGASVRAVAATLTPDSDPIVEGPRSVSVVAGEEVTFYAQLALQAGDVVEWVSTGGNVSTATCTALPTEPTGLSTCELSAPALVEQDGSLFAVRVTRADRDLAFESRAATLTVNPTAVPVVITSEPASQTVPAGQSAVFKIEAEGTRYRKRWSGPDGYFFVYSPPRVQWFKNGVAIPGAIGYEVVIPTTSAQAGSDIQIAAKVSNPMGTTVSEVATLSVASVSTVVGAAGGNVPGPKGSFLTVPAGALSNNVTIAITEEDIPAGLVPPEFVPFGRVINVSAGTAPFAEPAELRVEVPSDIGTDQALAILRIDELGNLQNAAVRRLSATGRSAALPAALNCTNTQNTDATGKTSKKISGGGKLIRGVVNKAACATVDELLVRSAMPSTTDQACQSNADFAQVRPLNSDDEKTLVSRHVDCRRTLNPPSSDQAELDAAILDQTIRLQVDLLMDASGKYSVLKDPTAPLPPGSSVGTFEFGTARLESRLSVHGPSSGLAKQLRYELRLSNFKLDSNYPAAATGAPFFFNVVFQPNVTCAAYSNSVNPTCTGNATEISVPLFNVGWSYGYLTQAFNWTRGPDQTNDLETFKLALNNYFYKMKGASFIYYGSQTQKRTVDSRLAISPLLRCDRGVAKGKTSGCVFVDAAPVFDMTVGLPPFGKTPEAREHVAEAQRQISGSPGQKAPGKFLLKPGTRAVADPSAEGLTRLKNKQLATNNYNASCNLSTALIVVRPENISASCRLNLSGCQCDEFPFKSTFDGAAFNPARTSVKIIRGKEDNSLSGSRLGTMLERERVADLNDYVTNPSPSANGDKFWVYAPP